MKQNRHCKDYEHYKHEARPFTFHAFPPNTSHPPTPSLPQVAQCTPYWGGTMMLKEPSVDCGSSDHTAMVITASFMFVFFVVWYPLFTTIYVWRFLPKTPKMHHGWKGYIRGYWIVEAFSTGLEHGQRNKDTDTKVHGANDLRYPLYAHST